MRATSRKREALLASVMLVPLLVIMSGAPIPQDPGYHLFADVRTCLGVPNFFNVASNLAFLFAGVAGLRVVRTGGGATLSWRIFFLGTALVCLGSAYYHTNPGNGTLLWDRLPMTVAFMGLFAALVTEHAAAHQERALLVATVAIGIASIVWWHYTNDLRPYVWVQLAPFLAIFVLLATFPGRYNMRINLLYGLIFYALAKAVEVYDQEVYALTRQWISGHTIKHLLAAVAVFFVYLMLRRRTVIPALR